MNCPKCGVEAIRGQNYCGGCGAQLKNACPGCSTVNPPFFKFCGACGRNLVDVGSLLLDQAGLILAADAAALKIIGQKAGTIKGKPFSLFVKIDDLVVFYSHWNELARSAKRQSVEIELTSSAGAPKHAQIEMGLLRGKDRQAPRIHLALSDVSQLRLALQDAQTLQDLVHLIFSWDAAFHPARNSGRELTIAGVLEKIGLFAGAQYGFFSRIAAPEQCLVTDFTWRLPAGEDPPAPPPAMPIALMARLYERLCGEHEWIVNDVQTLSDLERKALRQWHRMDPGAIICHMVYRRQTPIGIIGVAAARPMRWSAYAVSLTRLAGRLMAETLPYSRPGLAVIQPSKSADSSAGPTGRLSAAPATETIDIAAIEIIEEPPDPAPLRRSGTVRSIEGTVKPRMKFGSDKQAGGGNRQPVFAGPAGQYEMTCPRCGFQDTVSARMFDLVGSAVRVQCPCSHRFRIIRELRTTFRKQVLLEGYFAQAGLAGDHLAAGEVWGPMMVQDISRSGLKFKCRNAGRLRTGDRLQVRFNLDNANQTLIKKTVIVKSVQGDTAGCQFHGTDAHDSALGFYFL